MLDRLSDSIERLAVELLQSKNEIRVEIEVKFGAIRLRLRLAK